MRNTHIFAYNNVSKSSSELAKALSVSKIHHRNSRVVPSPLKNIINWGAGSLRFPQRLLSCNVINQPTDIDICSNKLIFFTHLKSIGGISHPRWTTSLKEVSQMQQQMPLIGRKNLQAHSGKGIIILHDNYSNIQEWSSCPLWVEYIPKPVSYTHLTLPTILLV